MNRRSLLNLVGSGVLMPFANPIIGAAGALIRQAIRSPNFVPNSAGWTINKDGSAEFSNVALRGSLSAGTLPSGSRVVIDNTGIRLFNASNVVVMQLSTDLGANPNILNAFVATLQELRLGALSPVGSLPNKLIIDPETINGSGVGARAQIDQEMRFFDVTGGQSVSVSLKNGGRRIPRGELGYAEITAIDTGSAVATETDIPGLSVTFTLDYSTNVETIYKGILTSTVGTDTAQVFMTDGTTHFDQTGSQACSGAGTKWMFAVREVLAAGTYTRKLTRARVAGTGQVRMTAAADQHAFIWVRDIGG